MLVPRLFSVIFVACFAPLLFGGELQPGGSVQNSLRPGATEAYTLNLQAGDLVSMAFTDTGPDVILSVLNPGGEPARRFSSKLLGGDPFSFYAAQSGGWQIVLAGRDKKAECGYKISDLKITKSEALLKPAEEIKSPRLRQLTDAAAVAAFWSQIAKEGAPLIEPIPDDPRNMLVTIVWRGGGDAKGVMVQAQFCDGDGCFMKRLGNTDVWYASFKVERRVRTYYGLVPGVSSPSEQYELLGALSQRDPLNPKGWFEDPDDPDVPLHHGMSKLEMPYAPAQPWADKRKEVPEGKVEKHSLTSALLKNTRDVWVYTPPGYSKTAPPYGLLLVFDGDTYIKVVPTPVTVDNLKPTSGSRRWWPS